LALAVLLAPPGEAHLPRCPPDSVAVGPVCVDKYEGSVWSIPADNKELLGRVRRGRVSLEQLADGGALQLGAVPMSTCNGFEYGAGFPSTGNWTAPLYAVSVAGVPPSTCITWFQAEQACRLSGKRLIANGDWQAAASGTPDPGMNDDGENTCATNSSFAALTGARSACRSVWGAYDMGGNVWEWVSEWINPLASCTNWVSAYGGDLSCMGLGAASPAPTLLAPRELVEFNPSLPGSLIRGGNFATGDRNGIFAVFSGVNPSNISRSTGFRCAR
jgi:formylglycine-generating enzyme required for sulfatase activity